MCRTESIAVSVASLVLAAGTAAALAGGADGDAPVDTRVMPATRAAAMYGEPVGPVGLGTRGAAPAPVFVLTGSDPEGDSPADIVFTDDGETIIIAHRESGNLILWDADTRGFLGSAPISGLAQSVDVTPDGQTAVVAGINTQTAHIVDLGTLTETDVIGIGQVPGYVSISPDGTTAAVHAAADGETYLIDIATATVLGTVPAIDSWGRLSFSFEAPAVSVLYGGPEFIDNGRLFNVDLGADEIQFIDAATGVVNRIGVADSPFRYGISADGTTAVVAHSGSSRTLTIVDLATETVTGTISTTFDLSGQVAVNADATRAVVAVQNAARVIDLTTGNPIGFELNTASNNDIISTFDGQYAVGIGFRGPVIDFATASLLALTNEAVSCEFGAVSPVDYRAAMCSTTFGDDLVVVETDGDGSPGIEAYQLSGPLEEGDRCRTVAMSEDGSVAVGVSIFSDTATIIDPATGSVTGWAPVGQRPSGVAISPDGTTAVVANLDSSFASVIDLATATTTNINISRRGSQVEISPDGQYAYIPVVADGDGVWRINLGTLSVEGFKLPAGNMGGVGYSYNQSSGIDLSADGSKLAVAGSFDNVVTIIDTATWTVEHNVPTGDFPTWVAFSDDGTRLFASIKNEDQVEVIDMTLGTPAVVAQINVGDQPWHLEPDLANGRLYVNAWGDTRIDAVDLGLGVLAMNRPLAGPAVGLHLDKTNGVLYAADGTSSTALGGTVGFERTEDGRLTALDPATLGVSETTPIDFAPSALAVNGSGTRAAMACPTGDGVILVVSDGACNAADLAEPFGVLDLADIAAFVPAFLAMEPAADLAAPFGVWDLADLTAFVTAFNGGCP